MPTIPSIERTASTGVFGRNSNTATDLHVAL